MKFSSFFQCFYKVRFVSLSLWIGALVACGFFAFDFLDLTNVNFIPPDNSPAAKANQVFKEQFPDDYVQSRFVVLMQMTDKNNTDYPDILAGNWTYKTTELIIDAAKNFKKDPDLFVGAMGRYTFEGQYDPNDEIATKFLRTSFVSANNRSSIMIMATKEKATQRVMKWVKHMRSEIEKMDKVNGTFTIDIIGFDTLTYDMTVGTSEDLKVMDSIALPIALLVFIAILRSLTVAIIPVIAVGSSLLLSFAIMVPIAHVVSIPSYCPAIMMSIVIAMSIDYCLFLLTRFHEELNRGHAPIVAAENMLRYSGETILKSGLVFTVCLASLIVFPLEIIEAVGIGAVVALLSTMLVALTLIPSIICIGLHCFSIQGLIPCITKTEEGGYEGRCLCCCDKNAHKKHELGKKMVSSRTKFEMDKTKHWYQFANWATKVPHAVLIIILMCALLAPFCCGMLKWETVINQDQVLPRKSDTHDAIARFSKEWPVGELYSFDIVAVPKNESETLFTDEFFTVFHDLAVEITNKTEYFNMTGVLSPSDLGDNPIDFGTATTLVQFQEFAYLQVLSQQMNQNQTAAKMTLAANINPNLNASKVPLAVRPIVENFTENTNFSFYLTNEIVDMHDAVSYTFKVFPYIIIAMAGVIVVMVIVAFQAPVLSLHMLFTIALTIVWSYGVISVIFATDWFYWVSDHLSAAPGIYWVVPILSLPILIGLALDYNIFLFNRIHEYRQRGWAPRAAVIMGVTKSGEVILFAGVIMAVAFSGLMFSGLMLMNQFGVLLALGVLLDTYVISTTLNPALIYIFGPLNYWPRHFPIIHEDPAVFSEDTEGGENPEKTPEGAPPTETTPLSINTAIITV